VSSSFGFVDVADDVVVYEVDLVFIFLAARKAQAARVTAIFYTCSVGQVKLGLWNRVGRDDIVG
jgi:hypothetical protein